MKKQELVHLHNLLVLVADFSQQEGSELDLTTYKQKDIHPMSINASKDAHEEAVLLLAKVIAAGTDAGHSDPVAQTAD